MTYRGRVWLIWLAVAIALTAFWATLGLFIAGIVR